MSNDTSFSVHTTTAPSDATVEPSSMPIVVGVDGSAESLSALRTAAQLAERFDAPLQAVLAWQIPTVGYAGYPAVPGWSPEEDAQRLLDAMTAEAFGTTAPERFSTRLQMGAPGRVLAEFGTHARLLVTGGHGHSGFAGVLLGSVSEAVARHAPCPVLVLRGEDHDLLTSGDDRRPIVVGIDGSPASLDALRLAADFAGRLHAPLQVLIAWHEPMSFGGYPVTLAWSQKADAQARLTACLTEVFGPDIPTNVHSVVRQGRAATVLIDAARDARLLVMGARGWDGFAGLLLGSATEACVRHSVAPILIVPDRHARIERLAEAVTTPADSHSMQHE